MKSVIETKLRPGYMKTALIYVKKLCILIHLIMDAEKINSVYKVFKCINCKIRVNVIAKKKHCLPLVESRRNKYAYNLTGIINDMVSKL